MAACLITIAGESGEVRINYNIGVTPHFITAGIGTLYIEDTATGVTYTTLSGDAIASSGCLTITEAPSQCFLLEWKGIDAPGYMIDAVILGEEIIPITETEFPRASSALSSNINSLADDRIKIVQFNYSYTDPVDPTTFEYAYIMRVFSTFTPYLRVKNSDGSSHIYIHGESSLCSVVGFEDVNIC